MSNYREASEIPQEFREEEKKPEAKIVLHFFRHGEKATDSFETPREVPLAEKGRKQAIQRGKELKPRPDVSIAIGSPRVRAQETAARVMLAKCDEIREDMSLEEIERVITETIKVGRKIVSDERLNFHYLGEFGKEAERSIKEERYVSFLVEESDDLALKLDDRKSTPYSVMAGNIAEVLLKYERIAHNWQRVCEKDYKKYQEFAYQLERYFGTHGGVLESFCAKIVGLTQGAEAQREFIGNNQKGFDELVGFSIRVEMRHGIPIFVMDYPVGEAIGSVEFSEKQLRQIIQDKKDYETKFFQTT